MKKGQRASSCPSHMPRQEEMTWKSRSKRITTGCVKEQQKMGGFVVFFRAVTLKLSAEILQFFKPSLIFLVEAKQQIN